MKYFSSQMPRKEMEEIVRDEMRRAQVVIPLAFNDEKLALTTSTDDGAIVKDQCARPQNEPGRTFHCSVCNTTLYSKPDYEDHIAQIHKKRLIKKGSRRSNSSTTNNNKTSIDHDLVVKNKTMNPAKIVDHSSLIYAEKRLINARYKHQARLSNRSRSNSKSETVTLLTDGSPATDASNNNAVVDAGCQTPTTLATRTLESVSNSHSTSCKITSDSDKLHRRSLRSPSTTTPHRKRRKLRPTSDIIDFETEDQKIQRALSQSSQEPQVEVVIDPIISNVSSCSHPVLNDPNNYCRVCHVSHSTQKAYQIHLQTVHHVVVFPSSSTKRKVQKLPVVTRTDKLYKHMPIQIIFDHKPSPTTSREQMKDASVQPDLDNPNHYCRSCHITKPNRTSYLAHLCMIHQITSRKKSNIKAPSVKKKKLM